MAPHGPGRREKDFTAASLMSPLPLEEPSRGPCLQEVGWGLPCVCRGGAWGRILLSILH